mmetsp:Transcript_90576/g.251855  ORF Transcript_90576/g.251855 Transcript_90576/m.251855 type:complete len:233 (-) Transcript_90576:2510-3208(-)
MIQPVRSTAVIATTAGPRFTSTPPRVRHCTRHRNSSRIRWEPSAWCQGSKRTTTRESWELPIQEDPNGERRLASTLPRPTETRGIGPPWTATPSSLPYAPPAVVPTAPLPLSAPGPPRISRAACREVSKSGTRARGQGPGSPTKRGLVEGGAAPSIEGSAPRPPRPGRCRHRGPRRLRALAATPLRQRCPRRRCRQTLWGRRCPAGLRPARPRPRAASRPAGPRCSSWRAPR